MTAHATVRPPRRSLAIAMLLVLCIVAPSPSAAADEPAPKAENAVDPFDGKPVDPAIAPVSLTVAGRTWVIGFSSEANRREAQADPRRAVDLHRKRLGGDADAGTGKPAPKR